MSTKEIVEALKGQLSERSVKDYLSEAVELGHLERPKPGIYLPKSANSAEGAEYQSARLAFSTQTDSANSAEVIGVALSALSDKSNEDSDLANSANGADPIDLCTVCTPDEREVIEL
jgi:hypothetical protein